MPKKKMSIRRASVLVMVFAGVVAAMGSLGVKTEDARVANRFLNYGGVRIPLDPSGCILLNYRPFEKWVDTKPQPIRAIESSINWLGKKLKRSPIEFYSYADVLEDRVHPGAFRDAVVLVGQCVWGSREDVHVTPYGSQFGVFVQAVLVYTTLTRRFLVPVSPWATVAAMMILSLALGAFCFRLRYRGSTYVVVVFGCLLVGLGLVSMGHSMKGRAQRRRGAGSTARSWWRPCC